MSDDEDEMPMDFSLDQSGGIDGSHDMMGFGPLLPTESERSLMERVRQELKIELKQVFIRPLFLTYQLTHASVYVSVTPVTYPKPKATQIDTITLNSNFKL